MPTIFQPDKQHTRSTSPVPLVNPGIEDAKYAGLASIGKGVSQAGDLIGKFAVEEARHVSKGLLAEQELERASVKSAYETFVRENPGKPTEWETERQRLWGDYTNKFNQNKKKQHWTKEAVELNEEAFKYERAKHDILAEKTTSIGKIQVSNANIMNNAYRKLREGDREGYLAEMNTVQMDPEALGNKIRQDLKGAVYEEAYDELSSLRRHKELDEFIARINAKGTVKNEKGETILDEEGKPVEKYHEYEYGEGGMSKGARSKLTNIAKDRKRQLSGRHAVAERRMWREIDKNMLVSEDVVELYMQGEISEAGRNAAIVELNRREYAESQARTALGNDNLVKQVDGILALNVHGGKFMGLEITDKDFDDAYSAVSESIDTTSKATRIKQLEKIADALVSTMSDDWHLGDGGVPFFDRDIPQGSNQAKALEKFVEYMKEQDMIARDPIQWGNYFLRGKNHIFKMYDSVKKDGELPAEEALNRIISEVEFIYVPDEAQIK